MKRAGRLFERITAPGNLLGAYLKARRGKRQRAEVQAFTADLDTALGRLRRELLEERCRFDRYCTFSIRDPKHRVIHAAPFPDRVLHHAILNVCEPFFERAQIFDSFACRRGKGTRAALFRAQQFTRRYPWFLKLDVRKYFHSIDHERLKQQLQRLFKDRKLLGLLDAVLDGCPLQPGLGLPIGNLTSQFFANHYLAGMDRYLKEELRAAGYVRYMDDFVLWGRSTQELSAWERQARAFCRERLGLELKPPCINRSLAGLPFLGFLVRPSGLRLTSRSCRRIRHKLKTCLKRLERRTIDEDRAAASVRSLLARTDWGSGANVRRHLMADGFGRRPKAGTGSTAAVAGPTTPATAAVPTATTGNRTTATTTSVSGWFLPPAQENGRMSPVDPGGDPVPAPNGANRDEVEASSRVLVGRVDSRVERSRQLLLFPEIEEEASRG